MRLINVNQPTEQIRICPPQPDQRPLVDRMQDYWTAEMVAEGDLYTLRLLLDDKDYQEAVTSTRENLRKYRESLGLLPFEPPDRILEVYFPSSD
jgi:hypothetical protein